MQIQETKETSAKETWRVRRFRDEDKASLLKLSHDHYGDKEQGTPDYFNWLYSETPAGRPYVMVAEEIKTGDIIGFLWHIPLAVNVNDQMDICYQGCNGLVRSDYRRQGIYEAIHQVVHQNKEDRLFIHGFPKPIAGKALEKMGHVIVTQVPLLTRPLQIGRLAEARKYHPWLRLALQVGWKIAGHTLFRPQAIPADRWGFQLASESEFDESFDHFWQRISGKYEIMVVRDRRFLNWRFRQPGFRPYAILTARQEGELVGYAVTREASLEGIETGLIMDFLVEPGERGDRAGLALVQLATSQFAAAGLMMAGSLLLPHTQEYGLLRRSGYVAAPARFAPQLICLSVYALAPRTSNQYLDHTDRWFISMANHDAV